MSGTQANDALGLSRYFMLFFNMRSYQSENIPQRLGTNSNKLLEFVDLSEIHIIAPSVLFDQQENVFYFSDPHMLSEPNRFHVNKKKICMFYLILVKLVTFLIMQFS